jgi:hypothetical protein
LNHAEQECSREYRKYYNTVAVSAAISNLFKDNPLFGRFIGESHELRTDDDKPIKPDITTVYNSDSKGLLFEIKYSTQRSARDVLLGMKRYLSAKTGWGTATRTVDSVDVVLVCHGDDTATVHQALVDLAAQNGNEFLKSDGFSLWQWIIGSSKEGEHEEAMWLQHIAGSCRNSALQQQILSPGGIRIPDEVLQYLRFQRTFVRDKPPVQYTILFLLQHVLPKDPDKESYDIPLEIVYQRANSFFPSWWESTETTMQVKRQWIKEALTMLCELGLVQRHPDKESYAIPRSLLEKRNPLRFTCRKLARHYEKRAPRGRTRQYKIRVTGVAEATLEPFLER